ncbi:MAG: VOC family protein [Thermoanaerobaculia bacterium]
MEVTKHEPGSFCWVELITSDRKNAVKFYTSLFGWTVRETPMGGDDVYVVGLKKGRDVCGMHESKQFPPNWGTYVAVTSADESAAKAKKLGAKVMMEPFDVMDLGRMSVISDPQGAVFSIWQAKKHPGVGIYNEPGAYCWSEVMTSDVEGAKKFYTSLFGWGAKQGGDYTEWQQGKTSIGGLMKNPMPNAPSMWVIYFMVDDVDASVKKAESMGAKVWVTKDIENVGRFSMMADPQGAAFSIIKLSHPM